jgi:hypothetical protein
MAFRGFQMLLMSCYFLGDVRVTCEENQESEGIGSGIFSLFAIRRMIQQRGLWSDKLNKTGWKRVSELVRKKFFQKNLYQVLLEYRKSRKRITCVSLEASGVTEGRIQSLWKRFLIHSGRLLGSVSACVSDRTRWREQVSFDDELPSWGETRSMSELERCFMLS